MVLTWCRHFFSWYSFIFLWIVKKLEEKIYLTRSVRGKFIFRRINDNELMFLLSLLMKELFFQSSLRNHETRSAFHSSLLFLIVWFFCALNLGVSAEQREVLFNNYVIFSCHIFSFLSFLFLFLFLFLFRYLNIYILNKYKYVKCDLKNRILQIIRIAWNAFNRNDHSYYSKV